MKNRIHYSLESRRDLDDIWDYIVSELQNRSAAEHVTNRIMDAVDQLKSFAEMGTLLSSIADVGSEYRYLVSGNYMVFYRIQGSDVYIDRVLYGRSNYINLKIPVYRIRGANSAPQETKNSFLKKSNNLHRKPAEIIRFQRVFWSE